MALQKTEERLYSNNNVLNFSWLNNYILQIIWYVHFQLNCYAKNMSCETIYNVYWNDITNM